MFVTKFLKASLFLGFVSICLVLMSWETGRENKPRRHMVIHEANEEAFVDSNEMPVRYVSNHGTSKKEHDRKIAERMAAIQKMTARKNTSTDSGGLPIWDKKSPIVFLHIGKCGGTSFDRLMPQLLSRIETGFIF